MKKFLLLTSFLSCTCLGFSQEVGVRFGEVLGNNVALDAVFSLGEFNRIHADISFGNDLGIEALWNPIYRPLGGEDLNWYLGVGPSILIGDPFLLGISGEIGLEYRFKSIPITVSADWRPTLFIIEETEFETGGFGFNIRFVFGHSSIQ